MKRFGYFDDGNRRYVFTYHESLGQLQPEGAVVNVTVKMGD